MASSQSEGWEVMCVLFAGLRTMARRVGMEDRVAWRRVRWGWEVRVAVQWWVKSFEISGVGEAITEVFILRKERRWI